MRLGLIGAGRWGKRYIATIRAMPDVDLAHLASRNPASLDLVPPGCAISGEWRGVVEDRSLDGVIVATPPHTHASIALAVIEAEVPVLIEKPMTLTVADARKIAGVAAKRNRLAMVDHTHLFSPAYRELKRRGTALGQLQLIETCGANWGPFRSDASMLWDYGPHDVAMAIDLVGRPPHAVAAHLETRMVTDGGSGEAVRVRLRFEGGVEARLRVANIDRRKSRWLKATYSGGVLFYDDLGESKLTFDPAPGAEAHAVHKIEVDPTLPLTVSVREFCSRIAAGQSSDASLELAVHVVEVLAACDARLGGSSSP